MARTGHKQAGGIHRKLKPSSTYQAGSRRFDEGARCHSSLLMPSQIFSSKRGAQPVISPSRSSGDVSSQMPRVKYNKSPERRIYRSPRRVPTILRILNGTPFEGSKRLRIRGDGNPATRCREIKRPSRPVDTTSVLALFVEYARRCAV